MSRTIDLQRKRTVWAVVATCAALALLGTAGVWSTGMRAAMTTPDKVETRVGAVDVQVPIPKTAADVPGPAPDTAMTTAYVQMVGRTAYLWGWALVNNANRHAAFSKAPEPGLIGGVWPQVKDLQTALKAKVLAPGAATVNCPIVSVEP